MRKSNEELQLLRQYVNTLQNQMKSKNQQIRTLNIEIQNLSKSQSTSNISRSQVVYTSNCNQCIANKQQLKDFKAKYSVLESSARLSSSRVISSCSQCSRYKRQAQDYKQKYQSLLRAQNSSSVRSSQVIYSSNCSQCTSLRGQLQQLQQTSTNYSTFVSSSSTNQQIQYFKREYLKILDEKRKLQAQHSQCKQQRQWGSQNLQLQSAMRTHKEQILALRLQLHKKEEVIRQLRSQLMSYSQKINNLQRQIQTLARTNNSTQINSQRLRHLNGQIQHYLALSNSLKSQIQVLKQENHSYVLKIRQLQNRPKQIQYVQVQPSFDLKQSVQELRREIADLNNDNYLIQQQNENLRLRLIQLSRKDTQPQIIEVIRTENHSPLRLFVEQERVGRHYRKHHHKDNSRVRGLTPKNATFFQKQKYNDIQRRIYMLQVQNENLKTNFYTKI